MGRICKNEITDHIRDHFRANPLKAPEARIQPMCVLEVNKNKQQYLGEFRFLVKGGFDHDVPSKEDPVAGVSDKRSKSTSFSLGFDILSGFLKSMSVDPASVSASFSRAKKMAFSFSNVRRRYIDVLQLGNVMSHNEIFGDKDNFMLHPAINDKHVRLGLITDVILSNNFSVSAFSDTDAAVKVEIPMIQDAIGNINADLKVEQTAENEVKFEGPNDLTFAFTCLEIKIDPNSGRFSRGDWMRNIKGTDEQPRSFESLKPGEELLLDHLQLDDNEANPLLIEL